MVGRLAARLGLRVRLEPGPDRGVRAAVSLPFTLVEYADDDADREPSFEESLAALGAAGPGRTPGLGRLSPRAAPDPEELVTGPPASPSEPAAPPAPTPEPVAPRPARIPAVRPATPIVRPDPTPAPPREPVRSYTDGGLPVRPRAGGGRTDPTPAPPSPAPGAGDGLPSRRPTGPAPEVPAPPAAQA